MVCPRKERYEDGGEGEDLDRDDGVEEEGSGGVDRTRASAVAQGSGRASQGLQGRLTDALREGGDGDLLLELGQEEGGILQWLRALDLQVLGACRADERLKPLLKFSVSEGVAEDRLIYQLSQHFEVTEVGTLARCLCIPLVSVRVGRVNKEGNRLCPTARKGYLQLTLLPSSDMRLSFCGDDGVNEKLVVVSHLTEDSDVTIEEILADGTGRTFLLRVSENHVLYFWCSEKSKLLGSELLSKMKDLLQRRPSLSQLTGISAFRLDAFATHLRAYLLRSSTAEANSRTSSTIFVENSCSGESNSSNQLSSTISRSSHSHLNVGQSAKPHPSRQSSLSLRPNNFKDGLLGNSLMRNATKLKPRQDGGNKLSLTIANDLPVKVSTSCLSCASSTSEGDDKLPECGRSLHNQPCCFPEMPNLNRPSSLIPLSFGASPCQVPATSSSLFSPYYCWCPPCTSSLQNTVTAPHLPSIASEPMLLPPPLSSVLSSVGSSLPFGIPNPSLDLSEVPALDLPSIFPLPSPFVSKPSTQQIPTFTPFMSDPIVHIPVIDVCSSGQGYLVSAGPAISSAVPPLLSSIASPLIPEAESAAEKNARETLRMLMASTPTNPQLIKVLPAVLTSVSEDFPGIHGMNHGALVAGSRGLYSGTKDVTAAAKCFCSSVGISSSAPPKVAVSDHILKHEVPSCTSQDKQEDLLSEGSCCAEEAGEWSSD